MGGCLAQITRVLPDGFRCFIWTLWTTGKYQSTQEDVQELAKIMTGWRPKWTKKSDQGTDIRFMSDRHEPGKKTVLGNTYKRGSKSLKIVIKDDGQGFDISATNYGYGLRNIRRLVKSLDGTLQIDSLNGTSLIIIIPDRILHSQHSNTADTN